MRHKSIAIKILLMVVLVVSSSTMSLIPLSQSAYADVMDAATPSITDDPEDQTVNEGQAVTLSLTVSGGTSLTYQWYRTDDSGTIAYGSAKTISTLTIPSLSAGVWKYYCIVTNTDDSVEGVQTATATSRVVTITVNALANAAAPSITKDPEDKEINEREGVNLSVTASGSAVLTYQWYRTDASGTIAYGSATSSPTLTIPSLSAGVWKYYCIVTNTDDSVEGVQTATATSRIATITVNALANAAAPSITTGPQDHTVNQGEAVTLWVTASGSPALTYQWYRNNMNSLIGGTAIGSATSSSLVVPSSSAGTIYYYCIVTNTDDSVAGVKTATATSGIAKITVNALANAAAPIITADPEDKEINEGVGFTLEVAANGSAVLSYQWYKTTDSVTIAYGSPSSSPRLNIPSLSAGTFYYYCAVTNTDDSVAGVKTATATSGIAKITVNALRNVTTPSIDVQPVDRTVKAGEVLTLSVEASGGEGLTYQWLRNEVDSTSGGAFVIDATNASFNVPTANTGTAYYYCLVTNTDNSAPGVKTVSVMSSTAKATILLPDPPVSPQNLVATEGNKRIALNWSSVTGATYYNIYMSTVPGQYDETPTAINYSNPNWTFGHLTNGTTYYFVVKAGNLGGLSPNSIEVSTTPKTVPSKPTDITAIAGDGQATINFTAPTDNGGSEITGYEVTDSLGISTITGTAIPVVITGLSNGTSYTFTVKAINSVGKSIESAASNAVIPRASSSGGSDNTTKEPTLPDPVITEPVSAGVDVLVNGKVENIGTATTTKVNGQTVTTVVIDQKKLEDRLAEQGNGTVVTIPVNAKSDVAIGQLNGQMVKYMADKQAIMQIRTEQATYTLPAQQINIDAISEQVGKSVDLQDIKIQIEIAAPTADTVKVVEDAAAKGKFILVVPSIDFTVRAIYGDKIIEISKFNAYVERTIAIPDGIDPNKITTGVVIDPDGTVRHIPTKVVLIDGKYYAQMNSMTNSTYSIVWHPLEFSDVANHWASAAVNDMGSRMIVEGTGNDDLFNPDMDLTRAEFAQIIVRGLGLKLENGATPFSDVKDSEWYSSVINTAYSYQLINGFEDKTFRPNDKITREQAMVVIAKAMTLTGLKAKLAAATDAILDPFADATKASSWALNSIADNVRSGIVSGRSSTKLAPKANITRAEAAVILQRLLKKSNLI